MAMDPITFSFHKCKNKRRRNVLPTSKNSANEPVVASYTICSSVSNVHHGDGSDHFFFPPAASASFFSHEITLPSMTTPLPSMKATRERPSQFLKESHTRGCCGWKVHCAISFDLSACGSSIFFPPVSFPIFHLSFEMRHAERPHRTKPMGE